jgi:hypothetical protein
VGADEIRDAATVVLGGLLTCAGQTVMTAQLRGGVPAAAGVKNTRRVADALQVRPRSVAGGTDETAAQVGRPKNPCPRSAGCRGRPSLRSSRACASRPSRQSPALLTTRACRAAPSRAARQVECRMTTISTRERRRQSVLPPARDAEILACVAAEPLGLRMKVADPSIPTARRPRHERRQGPARARVRRESSPEAATGRSPCRTGPSRPDNH